MNLELILENPVALRALTGLPRDEFDRLAEAREGVLQNATRPQLADEPRLRPGGGPQSSCPPRPTSDCILCYDKVCPLQHAMAALYGFTQSDARERVHRLTLLARTGPARLRTRRSQGKTISRAPPPFPPQGAVAAHPLVPPSQNKEGGHQHTTKATPWIS